MISFLSRWKCQHALFSMKYACIHLMTACHPCYIWRNCCMNHRKTSNLWVHVTKATPPLIHLHFNELHLQRCLSSVNLIHTLKHAYPTSCSCMILVIIMVEILIKSWKASIWSIQRTNWCIKNWAIVCVMDVVLVKCVIIYGWYDLVKYNCIYVDSYVCSHVIISITCLKEITSECTNTKQTFTNSNGTAEYLLYRLSG